MLQLVPKTKSLFIAQIGAIQKKSSQNVNYSCSINSLHEKPSDLQIVSKFLARLAFTVVLEKSLALSLVFCYRILRDILKLNAHNYIFDVL